MEHLLYALSGGLCDQIWSSIGPFAQPHCHSTYNAFSPCGINLLEAVIPMHMAFASGAVEEEDARRDIFNLGDELRAPKFGLQSHCEPFDLS